MKYLIEWILKGVITLIFVTPIMVCSLSLAIILWDDRFFDLCESSVDYIWRKRQ